MSNRPGDRYTCSNPECGCEIEIKEPCNLDPEELQERSSFVGSPATEDDESVEVSKSFTESELATVAAPSLEAVPEAPSLTCFCGGQMSEAVSTPGKRRRAGAS